MRGTSIDDVFIFKTESIKYSQYLTYRNIKSFNFRFFALTMREVVLPLSGYPYLC